MNNVELSKKYTTKLVLIALTAALVLFATMGLRVPFLNGYFHAGDGFIFAGAALLGPFAAIPAALGSLLSDFLVGSAVYLPGTLIIKGLIGFFAGLFLQKIYRHLPFKREVPIPLSVKLRTVLLLTLCELFMVAGYFLYEMCVFDLADAVLSLMPNAIQGLIGILLGVVLIPLTRRINFKKL